jgi:RNA polymerase sigma-70 factor (ECF subfamily)
MILRWMRRVLQSARQREFLGLLDTHGPTLMAMLRRLCGNAPEAEDVFQETAMRVWRGFAGLPRLRNPRAWVLTIGYRAFVDSRKGRERHDGLEDPVDERQGMPPTLAERSEECDRVQAAIAGLPDPSREVVVLHYVGGLTLRQTAAVMGISSGTVKSRLNATLNKLRSVLE